MAKYIVSRMVYHDDRIEVEAESKDEAIDKAYHTPDDQWSRTFLSFNDYEAMEEDDEH